MTTEKSHLATGLDAAGKTRTDLSERDKALAGILGALVVAKRQLDQGGVLTESDKDFIRIDQAIKDVRFLLMPAPTVTAAIQAATHKRTGDTGMRDWHHGRVL